MELEEKDEEWVLYSKGEGRTGHRQSLIKTSLRSREAIKELLKGSCPSSLRFHQGLCLFYASVL